MRIVRLVAAYGAGLALLAGCGGTTATEPMAPAPQSAPNTPSGSKTFTFAGKKQLFHVPSGVTQITIDAAGASGASLSGSYCARPGNGGLVEAKISVMPGEKMVVYVGGMNGFNGGGGSPSYGNGGGASDTRQGGGKLQNRVVVAGGGGGGGCLGLRGYGGAGGAGGGKVGATGEYGNNGYCGNDGGGGAGGTQKAGGAGGAGGNGTSCYGSSFCNGSAGGNGKFGGGGAAATSCGGRAAAEAVAGTAAVAAAPDSANAIGSVAMLARAEAVAAAHPSSRSTPCVLKTSKGARRRAMVKSSSSGRDTQ